MTLPGTPPPGVDRSTAEVEAHARDVAAYREARARRLLAADGWLALVGRHVLEVGDNELPGGRAHRSADGTVTLTLDGNATRPALHHVWPASADGPGPYLVEKTADGDRRWEILRQGRPDDRRVALRVRDGHSAAIRAFATSGMPAWPADLRFRVGARFEANPPGKTLALTTGLGAVIDHVWPGRLHFELGGQALHLDPVLEDDAPGRLFILFRDATSGKASYGGGRFLYADAADADGRVVLDFNRAYNPPCALTEFAACPLPPPSNRLAVAIEAGEKTFRHDL